MKVIMSLIALFYSAAVWGFDGDTFLAKSVEGVEMTFMVVSEAEKTCQVGTNMSQSAVDREQGGGLTIPASANGFTVVAIGEGAFAYTAIAEVHLPNTIKTIGYGAFLRNKGLKEIDIPESVVTIEPDAFWGCELLTNVYFHEGLQRIEYGSFAQCALTSIEYPQSIDYIGYRAFDGTPLASITVRSQAPFNINHDCFGEDNLLRAALYVPEGTAGIFKADSEWGRFRTIKEGEPLSGHPTDYACPEDWGWQYAVFGEPATIQINFVNARTTPISAISYILIIDGIEGEEHTYEFPQPIAADSEPFSLEVTLPDFDEPKTKGVVIVVTKTNGTTVDFGADIRPSASGTVAVYVPASEHKVMIRNYTAPSCVWALRSVVGLEKLKEEFGDKVVIASFHVDGPMWCKPYSYIPITPTCQVDKDGGLGGYYYDPYYGIGSEPLGILNLVHDYMKRPNLGHVKILSAQWADANQEAINIVTETTLGMSYTPTQETSYQIIFTLVEDGLTGNGTEWAQLNGYAEMTIDDPNLQPLTQLPYTIDDMVYNDVAVGEYQNYLWEPFTYGEPQQQTFTLQLSELTQSIIQDKSKLSVVACLQDRSNSQRWVAGDPIDSDKSLIQAFSSGVQTIKQKVTPNDVYDLCGRKVKAASTLNNLPKGIYIYGGKKIVIGNR